MNQPLTLQNLILRSAVAQDMTAILALMEPYACQGIVLRRTADEISRHLDNFIVAEQGGVVVGCVALRDYGDHLQEIRSLVVHERCVGAGIGSWLVQAAVEKARERKVSRVFALTLRPRLFERLGFELVDKDLFPEKVWSDCATCPKKNCCDEVAVVLELKQTEMD